MSAPPSNTRSGILLVDKPRGRTSHDVVSRVRRLAGTRKVGHAGTLDPMATGLLVLGINSSTRLLTYLVGLDKEYLATIRLGQSTTTDDAEGEVVATTDPAAVTDEAIAAGVAALTGPIAQVPSSFSAIKVDGKRAYALARAGETVELKARDVTISAFDVLSVNRGEFLDLEVRIECSSGTYIRALARDLGESLGVGGHLTALRRTRIGSFSIDRSSELESLEVETALVSPADVASRLFPTLELDPAQVTDLTHGKRIRVGDQPAGPIAALAPDGRLVGLLEAGEGIARPLVNFPTDEVLP